MGPGRSPLPLLWLKVPNICGFDFKMGPGRSPLPLPWLQVPNICGFEFKMGLGRSPLPPSFGTSTEKLKKLGISKD